ncbi:MAG: hypothetical protein AVDCRST_MAG60-485 [uncultured Nocardioides sp.]|uniref:Uncharacterized protein n=1 Tax=uncultured Nocardioides sp. TaxID=198441 RepID=A0A6J4N2B5_9ACTN|nr:MAG: hypothetical protein AVDCRST_MAG60-485 [uncultured Nocardioides sp.]
MEFTPIIDVDPFDLPDWLGVSQVVWHADQGLRTGHLVAGRLVSGDEVLACDLLAVDEAYPVPVTDDDSRHRAHQAWRHGQVLVGEYAERLTLAVPGTRFDAERVLDSLARLARAVGGSPENMAALLRIGAEKADRR